MTSRRWDPRSPRGVVPVVLAVLQAVLVLGPGLGRGVVITHDMPWSPDPRWTPFVLGLDTPAPRAVPSDAVAVLLGKAVGASMAQHLVLLTILVTLALGAAALLAELVPDVGMAGRCATVVAAVWNPFVSERLAVGQWVVVLGLAVLPWALRGALRVVRGTSTVYAVAPALLFAGLGGVNALLVVSGAVLTVLLAGAVRARSWPVARAAGVSLLLTAGLAGAWAVPALTARPVADALGARAFAPVADSPVGVIGSLLGGGGFWNTGTHPEPRSHVLIALTAALLMTAGVALALVAAPGRDGLLLAAPLAVFGVLVLLSVSGPAEQLWDTLVHRVPGGGALRDSQKLIAPWVVVGAAGLGVLADRAARRLPAGLRGPAVALLLGLPLVLSPQLAWGIGGRLDAVTVPSDYRQGVDELAALPPGDVGLLPWSQYRRYGWNDSRVSLTLAPRTVDRVVLYDDSLPLRSGTIAGESARAAEVSKSIGAGTPPDRALAAEGVRYVAAELGSGLDVDTGALRSSGRVVVDRPSLLVVDVGGPARSPSASGAGVLGWGVTLLTALGIIGWRGARRTDRKLLTGLLRSRP
ncbi:hypothetical protein [Knoellia locipacati]|nr:hypothetical protein [Knoellia locipacati]